MSFLMFKNENIEINRYICCILWNRYTVDVCWHELCLFRARNATARDSGLAALLSLSALLWFLSFVLKDPHLVIFVMYQNAHLETWTWKMICIFLVIEDARPILLSCFQCFEIKKEIIRGPHAGGPFCNILSASIRLPTPVPCNGELGCWRLPDKVREDVLKQIETETVPIFHFPEAMPWCSCQNMVKRNMNSGHHLVTCGFACLSSLSILYLIARIVIGSKDVHAKYVFLDQIFMKISNKKYLHEHRFYNFCLFSKLTKLMRSQIHPRPRGWPLPWAPELSRKDVYWHRLPEIKNGETEMKKTILELFLFFCFNYVFLKATVYLGVLVVWNWYQKP